MKNIVIAGGTGHLGSSLSKKLVQQGHEVTVLTRTVPDNPGATVRFVQWDGETQGSWTDYIDGADVVINLSGKSVNCRYSESNKLKLIQSRVRSTEALGLAIRNSPTPPKVWVNASSSAYYGFSYAVMDENASPGSDFPARICVEWEKSFNKIETPHTRKIAWRLGVVLQRRQGLILPFVNLVRGFTGGKLGSGKQYFTWIHEDDFLDAAVWTIENDDASGPYNLTSPEPVTNENFMKALRESLGVSIYFSIPELLLKLGGKIIGTEPYLILEGRRIIPARLSTAGFTFKHPNIDGALQNLFLN